jgi:hypothetical protein
MCRRRIPTTTVFARVSPTDKARIVRVQRRTGGGVAFLGDGVNDALALHAADVDISVDSGTDVAKDAAEVILLAKNLDVLADGVAEGRRIFANTIKYVLMGRSSNFDTSGTARAGSPRSVRSTPTTRQTRFALLLVLSPLETRSHGNQDHRIEIDHALTEKRASSRPGARSAEKAGPLLVPSGLSPADSIPLGPSLPYVLMVRREIEPRCLPGPYDHLGIDMGEITRRRFIGYGAGVGAALALPWTLGTPIASAAMGGKLAKYVQAVPLPGAGLVVATPGAPNKYAFTQRPISRQVHPQLPPTPLWAYDDGSGLGGQAGSFGMVVIAHSGTPVDITFTNALGAEFPPWLPVDTRLTATHDRTARVMTHLHGGFVDAASDGNPAVTPLGFTNGQTQSVHYSNQLPQMPPAQLWFHDHGLGSTRLGVVAGLAAAYVLRDDKDTGAEPNPIGIPAEPTRSRW